MKCLAPGFKTKYVVSKKYYMADPKAYRLEVSRLGLNFVENASNSDQYENIFSDQSEFIVRPVLCKRMDRNLWRTIQTHAGLSLSRFHVQ